LGKSKRKGWIARPWLLATLLLSAGIFLGAVGIMLTVPKAMTLELAYHREPTYPSDVEPETRVAARSLSDLCKLNDNEFEGLDIVELNLAIAREISSCSALNVTGYVESVDRWAKRVRQEIDRHLYKFREDPGQYNDSLAYFKALVMCTVVGQDFGVRYDREDFSFTQPEDLFLHGIIDRRKGTCISLPVLYVALGQRLGFPIRGVALPGHTFCRWDDTETGERFNIEAANLGGLTVHEDDYYRQWPFELDPRWEREHHVLKSLTLREYASVLVGALGAYFSATGDVPSTTRYDALACWLDPVNRSAFVSLRMAVEHRLPDFFDSDELAGRKPYWQLKPHPSLARTATHAEPTAPAFRKDSTLDQLIEQE